MHKSGSNSRFDIIDICLSSYVWWRILPTKDTYVLVPIIRNEFLTFCLGSFWVSRSTSSKILGCCCMYNVIHGHISVHFSDMVSKTIQRIGISCDNNRRILLQYICGCIFFMLHLYYCYMVCFRSTKVRTSEQRVLNRDQYTLRDVLRGDISLPRRVCQTRRDN